ncbi:sigma-70 family RNA polymerase sigma factor, partial [Candidatus Poribacteria bacterium]|nr:sigma-70 family RNA polymerase sigma factor [Candidatus Poribacteria bacterium]
AEEITQDIFLHVYKKLPTLKNRNQFPGWLYVIVNRQCIAWHRKKKPVMQSLETTDEETLDETAYECYVLEQLQEKAIEHQREIVQDLLEKLPESQRTVVILHYLGDMTCQEISKYLGVSPNTVKSRLSRARNRLREEEPLIRETLGSVTVSESLIDNIINDISDVNPSASPVGKPLLPFAAFGSAIVLTILLIGASNEYLNNSQLPYSFDAQSETAIEIVEVPVLHNEQLEPNMQSRVKTNDTPDQTNNGGLHEGKSTMQNNLGHDSTKWKLPEGAKTRLGKGFIFDMTYSPDGSLLAASTTIGIWIYDARTGEERNLITEHMDGSSTVAFSPNSQIFASDGEDNTILLWETQTGQRRKTLSGHLDAVNSFAFSPDGQSIVSGSDDDTIRLWDVSTGEELLTFAGHADGVSDVMFSPDGKTLASHGYRDSMIHLWNASTGEFLRSLTGHTADVCSIAYSPDGEILACSSEDGTVRLWEPDTAHLKMTITTKIESDKVGHGVKSVQFHPDGRKLVCNNYGDDMIQFWNVDTGEHLKTIHAPPDTTNHITISPDGDTLVYTGDDGKIRFWDLATDTSIRTLNGYAQMFRDMTYSPDGSKIVTVSTGPSIRFWDTHTGNLTKTYFNPEGVSINSVAYSPDGETLACTGGPKDYNTVFLLDTNTFEHKRVFTGRKEGFEAVVFSPDGKILAAGNSNGCIFFWDVNTGKKLREFDWNGDIIRDLTFSPDGKMLMSSSDSGACLWDITSGETIQELSAYEVVVSPDWKTFLGIGGDGNIGSINFWNFGEDEPQKSISSLPKAHHLKYAPDGQTFVSKHEDGKIRFWDTTTGHLMETFSGHIQGIWFLSYSPDGNTLATAGWDSTVFLWDVPK